MSSTTTTRYGLYKATPSTTELVNSGTSLWSNMDTIDQHLGCRVCTSSTRPASPVAGMLIFETDTLAVRVYDAVASKWRLVNPLEYDNDLTTTETTTSTSYTDLATVGPTVSNIYMTAGQRAEVIVSARAVTSAAGAFSTHMSYAVSGTETVAAADTTDNEVVNSGAVIDGRWVGVSYFTASAVDGNRTFTSKYRMTGAATGTWRNRRISVKLLSN